jgi:chromosome segregation ATPase
MPRTGVTFEQVAQAADALVGDSQLPTLRAIRERLGSGSPNTVHKHLTAWRAARPPTAASLSLSASLTAALVAEIERAVAQARAETEQQLAQAQAEVAELASAGEALEVEGAALVAQVVDLTSERDRRLGQTAEQATEIERLRAALEASQQARQQAEQAAAVAAARLADSETEINRLRAELEAARADAKAAGEAAAEWRGRLAAVASQ